MGAFPEHGEEGGARGGAAWCGLLLLGAASMPTAHFGARFLRLKGVVLGLHKTAMPGVLRAAVVPLLQPAVV